MSEHAVELRSRGGTVPALVHRGGDGTTRCPAIVLGVEAYGINQFSRQVAARLCDAGYVTVVPDYYRGRQLADPDNYLDFTEVVRFIDELDFAAATHDQLAAIEYAGRLDDVDPDRIAVWGYCTGATLSMLAAELSGRVAAAVLFFPSQPRFPAISDRRPVHPIDLLWALRCPALLIYGDQDPVMTADDLAEIRRRIERWSVDVEVAVYAGAGHAFTAPHVRLRHAAAERASWRDAIAFLNARMTPASPQEKSTA